MRIDIRVTGAVCGQTWMGSMASTGPCAFDPRRQRDRFSTHDATLRDVLLHYLMEHGGDFQSALFTADTQLKVTSYKPLAAGRTVTRTKVRGRGVTARLCRFGGCELLLA